MKKKRDDIEEDIYLYELSKIVKGNFKQAVEVIPQRARKLKRVPKKKITPEMQKLSSEWSDIEDAGVLETRNKKGRVVFSPLYSL